MSGEAPADPQAALARVEALVEQLEATADPALREQIRALVRAVLDVHALGLGRLLALAGPDSAERFARADELVASLLLLHDLHPDIDTAARSALRAAERPAPRSDFVPVAHLRSVGR